MYYSWNRGNANIKYDLNFSCSTDNFIIKTNKNILIKYIYYYFVNNMYILENGFVGSTIKHISKNYVQNIEIPIPSLEKQKEIVLYCDEIDTTIKSMVLKIKSNKILMKNSIETYLKTNNEIKNNEIKDNEIKDNEIKDNEIKDDENKSDTKSTESYDDKIIKIKPVKKINKKIESSVEKSINSNESKSKEDEKTQK